MRLASDVGPHNPIRCTLAVGGPAMSPSPFSAKFRAAAAAVIGGRDQHGRLCRRATRPVQWLAHDTIGRQRVPRWRVPGRAQQRVRAARPWAVPWLPSCPARVVDTAGRTRRGLWLGRGPGQNLAETACGVEDH